MIDIDPRYAHGLEVAVTAITGLTAGAMGYITIIDCPARAKLAPPDQLISWRAMFEPSGAFFKPMGMALVPALAVCAQVTDNKLYYVAAVPFAILGPFTALAIAPTNNTLLESETPASPEAGEKISSLVNGWAKLHAVRSALVLSSFAVAITACCFYNKSS